MRGRTPRYGQVQRTIPLPDIFASSIPSYFYVKTLDPLTKKARSTLMSKIRSSGNKSTEVKLRMALVREALAGWSLHPRHILGKPDFLFHTRRVLVFVDGCFWHGCHRCLRLPLQNRSYWSAKIEGNMTRAKKVTHSLRKQGFLVVRVWEHQLRTTAGLRNAVAIISQALQQQPRSYTPYRAPSLRRSSIIAAARPTSESVC